MWQVFGVKAGKIPLVTTTQELPEPSYDITLNENDEYEFLEDESYAASKVIS